MDLDDQSNKPVDEPKVPSGVGKVDLLAPEGPDNEIFSTARSPWSPEQGHIAPIASPNSPLSPQQEEAFARKAEKKKTLTKQYDL